MNCTTAGCCFLILFRADMLAHVSQSELPTIIIDIRSSNAGLAVVTKPSLALSTLGLPPTLFAHACVANGCDYAGVVLVLRFFEMCECWLI